MWRTLSRGSFFSAACFQRDMSSIGPVEVRRNSFRTKPRALCSDDQRSPRNKKGSSEIRRIDGQSIRELADPILGLKSVVLFLNMRITLLGVLLSRDSDFVRLEQEPSLCSVSILEGFRIGFLSSTSRRRYRPKPFLVSLTERTDSKSHDTS